MPTSGAHALIIEDEILIALELEDLLSGLGYRSFDIAASPREAVLCALKHRPDLITADYRIEQGTGVEAVADIVRAIGPVPVVFVTGNPNVVAAEVTAPIVDKPVAPGLLAEACRIAQAA